MAELSAGQQAFVNRMKEGEDFERQGVNVLLKRQDFETFFDALAEGGLFDPARNPKPVEAERPGLYRVPYWHILDYLKAVAKRSGETMDAALAEKVMTVVRSVSTARGKDDAPEDNYYTARVFAEILGLVPTSVVSMDDIDLIPAWLRGRFSHDLVGPAFSTGTLRDFVQSADPADWEKACRIVHHCTAIRWKESRWPDSEQREPETVIEDYWLKQLIDANANALGAKAGEQVARILLERLREVYSQELDKEASWVSRPAIEEHEQNHSWDGPANRFVEGLRHALLGWIDASPDQAKPFVERLLTDQDQIVRRIAIHVMSQRFAHWRGQLAAVLTLGLFDAGNLHETYHFLKDHFHEFSPQEQEAALTSIRHIHVPGDDEKQQRRQRRLQRTWLSVITGRGNREADGWFQELQTDASLGGMSPHPDFISYTESGWGFGDTPYTVQQLIDLAEKGTLVEALNNFKQGDTWKGPTARALADTVEAAVANAPQQFLSLLPEVVKAKREYQYAVISGFKRLWDASDEERVKLDWDDAWPGLFTLFESIIGDDAFWAGKAQDDEDLTPNRDWIPPKIAEFIRAGLRDDKKAFDPGLLPRSWALIKILLQKSEAQQEPSESDAMTRAINSSKGKAVEAMLDHALRACRVSDAATQNHAEAWQEMKPVFDEELAKCRNANFEFSTLAGAYISHLRYIDAKWYDDNFQAIFPVKFSANCLSALGGLPFAPVKTYVYSSLTETGVLDWALRQETKNGTARESLLQRIAIAFLWNQEAIDGPRLAYLFDAGREDDLAVIARYFWSVSKQKLEEGQVDRILLFWRRCVAWSQERDAVPAKLLSELALLSSYLKAVGDRELPLLLAVAPHVSVLHNVVEFIKVLERLAQGSPEQICKVVGALLESHRPTYDFEDRLKNLLRHLSKNPNTRPNALIYANQLVEYGLRGSVELYRELTG